MNIGKNFSDQDQYAQAEIAYRKALDIDPDHNELRWGKDRAKMAHPDYNDYWKFVEQEGGVSLGRERNMDYQHWQLARL